MHPTCWEKLVGKTIEHVMVGKRPGSGRTASATFHFTDGGRLEITAVLSVSPDDLSRDEVQIDANLEFKLAGDCARCGKRFPSDCDCGEEQL